mgnify:CR=1 FL=1
MSHCLGEPRYRSLPIQRLYRRWVLWLFYISAKTYNIPIIIWLHETHPYNAPMVYVQPTATMNIKAGPHVEANGTVQIPYLREWRQVSLLLRILVVCRAAKILTFRSFYAELYRLEWGIVYPFMINKNYDQQVHGHVSVWAEGESWLGLTDHVKICCPDDPPIC